jgi:hypothetical protein
MMIEVGGKSKHSQVKHLDNYLIASDDLETGSGNSTFNPFTLIKKV